MSSLLQENRSKSFDFKNQVLSGKGCFFKPNSLDFTSKHFGDLIIDTFKKTELFEMPAFVFFDSVILTDTQQLDFIKLCEFDIGTKFTLLYRATVDGFEGAKFHLKCDAKGKTLTIIKVKNNQNIFGGYTEAGWEGQCYKNDPNAFIFSLINHDKQPIKIKSNGSNSIWCGPSFGPIFGCDASDFQISTNSNTVASSFSNLGASFAHPTYQRGTTQAQNFLAGSYKFSTSEIEVFKLD